MVCCCVGLQELRWDELARDPMFPTNFDFLAKLLRVHPHPLKVLTCIPPAKLFHLFGRADIISGRGLMSQMLDNLVTQLADPQLLSTTSFAILPHVAVLKWCMFQRQHTNSALTFDGRDMRVLVRGDGCGGGAAACPALNADPVRCLVCQIDLKLPLELSTRVAAKADIVLPLLQQLDDVGYRDFLYGQVRLGCCVSPSAGC